jgi:hypothetical protein
LTAGLADQGSSQESAREGCTIAAAGDLWGRPFDSIPHSLCRVNIENAFKM